MELQQNTNKMKHIYKKLLPIIFLCIPLLLSGCGKTAKAPKAMTLQYWGVWNEASDIKPVINAFQAQYPYVTIKYTKLRYEEYQDQLITAWAQDRGPDIFSIPNSWVTTYKNFITPMPVSTTMVKQFTKESLAGAKKNLLTENVVTPGYNYQTLGKKYVDVVTSDVAFNNQIFGLPLSMDTLALYYNKDMLGQAYIAQPPAIWSEFVEIMPKLTLQDEEGNIIRSAAALGTAKNVDRSTDILVNLMIQNGSEVINPSGKVNMAAESVAEKNYFPGPRALEFYTDFASPTKQVYTWNENMPASLQAFAQGKTAFFFGYSYHYPLILSQAQGINFDITAFPQINQEQSVTLANYWVETVAKKSLHPNEAWAFLQYATGEDGVIPFLESSKRPTALRSIIASQASENVALAPFILQGLTAKSWYHGAKPVEAETILKNAITRILLGDIPQGKDVDPYVNVLQDASKKIQTTL